MRWRGRVLITLLAIGILATGLYAARRQLILFYVGTWARGFTPVAPNREIVWQRGPATAATPPERRPPNIVLIIADDLGGASSKGFKSIPSMTRSDGNAAPAAATIVGNTSMCPTGASTTVPVAMRAGQRAYSGTRRPPSKNVSFQPRNATAAPPRRALFWRDGHYRAVLSDGWKLQASARPDKVWLFHLTSDPTEQTNLAERQPEMVAKLQALLAAHEATQRPPLFPAAAEMPVWVDRTLEEGGDANDEYVYWPG